MKRIEWQKGEIPKKETGENDINKYPSWNDDLTVWCGELPDCAVHRTLDTSHLNTQTKNKTSVTQKGYHNEKSESKEEERREWYHIHK